MKPVDITHIPQEILAQFSQGPRECIERLMRYSAERHDLSVSHIGYEFRKIMLTQAFDWGTSLGDLRVLLTTRSKALRTHAGQTALPGGKVDEGDESFVKTAYREAHEEVELPLDSPDIHTIALLEPYISLYKIVVTPVIAVLTRPALLNQLKPAEDEVAHIFTHPLRAILDPRLSRTENLVAAGEDWPYDTELHNTTDSTVPILNNTVYRMHRFQSSASPIKGLTADILIKVAEVAYGEPTIYDRYAPGQLQGFAETSRLIDDLQQQA